MIRVVALAACLLGVSVAHAQTSNNQISYAAIMKASIGSWADYKMTKDDVTSVRVRYILVARDKKQVVIELDTISQMGGNVVVKMTFVPDPKESARWNLESAKLRVSPTETKDMPIPGQRDAKGASFGKSDSFGKLVGKEDVAVGAIKVAAEHFHKEAPALDVWMSDKVMPVGMVKLEGNGTHVELVGTGTGGKPQF